MRMPRLRSILMDMFNAALDVSIEAASAVLDAIVEIIVHVLALALMPGMLVMIVLFKWQYGEDMNLRFWPAAR